MEAIINTLPLRAAPSRVDCGRSASAFLNPMRDLVSQNPIRRDVAATC